MGLDRRQVWDGRGSKGTVCLFLGEDQTLAGLNGMGKIGAGRRREWGGVRRVRGGWEGAQAMNLAHKE